MGGDVGVFAAGSVPAKEDEASDDGDEDGGHAAGGSGFPCDASSIADEETERGESRGGCADGLKMGGKLAPCVDGVADGPGSEDEGPCEGCAEGSGSDGAEDAADGEVAEEVAGVGVEEEGGEGAPPFVVLNELLAGICETFGDFRVLSLLDEDDGKDGSPGGDPRDAKRVEGLIGWWRGSQGGGGLFLVVEVEFALDGGSMGGVGEHAEMTIAFHDLAFEVHGEDDEGVFVGIRQCGPRAHGVEVFFWGLRDTHWAGMVAPTREQEPRISQFFKTW